MGDLGSESRAFVEFLSTAGQRLWQILPLGPVGIGDSPYASSSAFAGNPLLISLDDLVADGLLTEGEVALAPRSPVGRSDPSAVRAVKMPILRLAFDRFKYGYSVMSAELQAFRERQSYWLRDFALFSALQSVHDVGLWRLWDPGLALRDPASLARAELKLKEEVAFQEFAQFLFDRQWQALRAYAGLHQVSIVGDLPIFVSENSADVWARRDQFQLDDAGRPTVVAGVPPDYFSRSGQHWGNPLFDWKAMADDGYRWWAHRVRRSLEMVDYVRLDHFRGFAAYWEIPAGETTAAGGHWVDGPGVSFFDKLRDKTGDLPFIAEDLGVLTKRVIRLRDELGLPGMRVLQFAFDGDPDNLYLPHNYDRNTVVYTGTHDNDTVRGWFAAADQGLQHRVRTYLGRDGGDISWDLIRVALSSVADWAVIPLQDVLDLGTEARMNVPGQLGGNWSWRFPSEALTDWVGVRLRDLTSLYGRAAAKSTKRGMPETEADIVTETDDDVEGSEIG
jgi:4-alpha-glucanotransferase